ncbi:hypothetical protein ACFST9_12280 [Hymenobacter monticola]|uniref:Uncharacterized protein n=1 Tax=Hymenobacter monticola TaxID=1705399 RepID=A0ABY4B799_9BACT|nr:hypothetical protein [Hymenobacter monticola]UOE35033.1 hypothetical protein MTP16_05130 [Hymenobacter monticola]
MTPALPRPARNTALPQWGLGGRVTVAGGHPGMAQRLGSCDGGLFYH